MEQQQKGRGRPREAATDDMIQTATLALLREGGPEAVNVAAVAARSGIARTTIYRRYRDREELLRAALEPITAGGNPPDDTSVREKLVWVLSRTQEVFAESIGLGGVAALVADSDPDFSAALRTSLDAALAPLQHQITHDVEQGQLSRHVDGDIVLNLILGAYLAEVLRYGSPRAEWLQRTAALLTTWLSPDPNGESPPRARGT